MVTARDVDLALIQALETIALQCNENPRRSGDWHVVRDFNATNAAKCEALCAAHVLADEGFRPDVYKSFKALGRDALHRHESPREAVVSSLKALRSEAQRPDGLNWLHDYAWNEIGRSQRARLASMAISWVARLSLALDQPDVSNWRGGVRAQWSFPDRALRLEATIDAVTEDGDLVLVAPASNAADAKAAYAAVVFAAANRRIPEAVVLVDPSRRTARTQEISGLLDDGVRTAESAARAVIAASARTLSGLSRSPSYFNCRSCPGLGVCSEGQGWLDQPVTVRGGIRIA